jgi:hypothetical protein
MVRRCGSPARGSARPCARPWRGGAARLPPARPASGLGAAARACRGAIPARPPVTTARLGHGGRSSAVASGAIPGVLRRPALAASARPWPRRGFGAVRSPARLSGLLARLARVACPLQRPARSARVARPRRRSVACPLASQLACSSPHGLLVAACAARDSPSTTCSQQQLARVRSNGPRPRSLARVACSPVQRLNTTLSHLPFVCELSREDALRHLKVLVPIELYQEAAITRHRLIMLR